LESGISITVSCAAIHRDMIRNLTEIAVEGWLSEELLRRDVGILAGILTNCVSLF